jgi:hypothetical protein
MKLNPKAANLEPETANGKLKTANRSKILEGINEPGG